MKKLLLLLLFVTIPVRAQEISIVNGTTVNVTVADDNSEGNISIVGPTEVLPTTETRFTLVNTPLVDLSKPLLTQLEWLTGANRIKVFLLKPGQPKEALNLKAELVFGVAGATLQPFFVVNLTEKGYYRIVLLENNELVEHLFTINVDPNPPIPDPIPDPTPDSDLSKNKHYQIMMFQDTDGADNLPLDQVSLLSGLKFRQELTSKGHTFRGCFDISAAGVVRNFKVSCNGKSCKPQYFTLPSDIQNWVQWFKDSEVSLPAVLFWDEGTQKIIVKSLPANETDFWNLFK